MAGSMIIKQATDLFFDTPSEEKSKGVDAAFVRMGGSANLGVKVYHDKYKRDKSVAIQSYLAEHDLAPPVYGTFELPNGVVDTTGHGYTRTFRYAMVTGCIERMAFEGDCIEFYNSYNDEIREELNEVRRQLERDLEAVGIYVCDIHVHNFGYDYDGSIKVIDVGHCDFNRHWFEDEDIPVPTY